MWSPTRSTPRAAYEYHVSTAARACTPSVMKVPVFSWVAKETRYRCDLARRRVAVAVNSLHFRCAARTATPITPHNGSGPGAERVRDLQRPKLQQCLVPSGMRGEWRFQRVGPLHGTGGYDWHRVLVFDVGGFAVDRPVNLDAWFIGATDERGATLGFPPVHLHHAHVRASACWRGATTNAANDELERLRVGRRHRSPLQPMKAQALDMLDQVPSLCRLLEPRRLHPASPAPPPPTLTHTPPAVAIAATIITPPSRVARRTAARCCSRRTPTPTATAARGRRRSPRPCRP